MSLAFALFERPFREEFKYGEASLRTRRGVILRKPAASGGFVYGEASPLPSHSSESLTDVLGALAGPAPAGAPPSLRFALESLDLLDAPAGKFHPVRTNALLRWRGEGETRGELEALAGRGFRHFKLKLPASGWEEIARVIAGSRGLRFRLDANGQLNFRSLAELLRILEAHKAASVVDYIEEPFAGLWSSTEFRSASVAFAADESASDPAAVRRLLQSANPPAVIVLKPAVYGSLLSLESLASEVESSGRRAVFTSTLECEPGRRALLAFLGRREREVSGLSTGFLFAKSFLPDQALWAELPAICLEERAWLDTLEWKECLC